MKTDADQTKRQRAIDIIKVARTLHELVAHEESKERLELCRGVVAQLNILTNNAILKDGFKDCDVIFSLLLATDLKIDGNISNSKAYLEDSLRLLENLEMEYSIT